VNIEQLIENFDSKNTTAIDISDMLLKGNFSATDQSKFVEYALQKGKYIQLDAVLSRMSASNMLLKHSTLSKSKVHDNLQTMLLILGEGINWKIVYPLLFACCYADNKSELSNWQTSARKLLFSLASKDFDLVFNLLTNYDPQFRTIDTLLSANKDKAIQKLLDIFFESDVYVSAKRAVRQILLRYSDIFVDYINKNYFSYSYTHKILLCNLLLSHSHNAKAKLLLQDIIESDKGFISSQFATKLYPLPKFKNMPTKRYSFTFKDSKRAVKIVDDIEIVFDVNDNFVPLNTNNAKLVQPIFMSEYQIFCKELEHRLNYLNAAMIRGYNFELQHFLQCLNDHFFAKVAESILFAQFKDCQIKDIFVINNGKFHNLENKKIELSDLSVVILHPVNLPKKYEYLKQMDIVQPLYQLSRPVFVADQNEKATNTVKRFKGKMIKFCDIKKASFGFANIKKMQGCLYTKVSDTIIKYDCINMEKDIITLGGISFYKSYNVTFYGSIPQFKKSIVSPIAEVDDKIFSESLRVVCG
jgi:hypothetical protein